MSETTTPFHPSVFSSLLAFSGPATLEMIRKQKRKKSLYNVSRPTPTASHIPFEYHARNQFRDHPKANETLSMMLEEEYYDCCCSIDESEQQPYEEPQDDDDPPAPTAATTSKELAEKCRRFSTAFKRRRIFSPAVACKYLIQIHQQVDDTSIFLDDETTYTSFCLQKNGEDEDVDDDDDDSIGDLKTHSNSSSMLATGTYY